MKFRILHEAPSMLRLRVLQPRMTMEQADLLESMGLKYGCREDDED